jgi:hypothetical protein
MGKAMGVVVGVFAMGTGASVLLGPLIGAYAEHAALGLVGLGLVLASQALAARALGRTSWNTPGECE